LYFRSKYTIIYSLMDWYTLTYVITLRYRTGLHTYERLRNFDDLRSGTVMRRSHEIEDAAYWLRAGKFHAPLGDDSYAHAGGRKIKFLLPPTSSYRYAILSPFSDYRFYRASIRSRDRGERDILAFVTDVLFPR